MISSWMLRRVFFQLCFPSKLGATREKGDKQRRNSSKSGSRSVARRSIAFSTFPFYIFQIAKSSILHSPPPFHCYFVTEDILRLSKFGYVSRDFATDDIQFPSFPRCFDAFRKDTRGWNRTVLSKPRDAWLCSQRRVSKRKRDQISKGQRLEDRAQANPRLSFTYGGRKR